jgi:hypothetical protein
VEYLDFEIEIGLGKGRNFPVRVLHSPAGEREGSMHFPFDELELENYLLRLQNALLATGTTRRRISSPSEGAVEEFGTALYEALLSGNIRTCYELSRREAQVQDKGLRIKMRLEDPSLAVLPWEFLYDRGKGEFVALSRYSPIVRYIDTESVTQPLRVAPPIRILGMIASPSDLPPLNVEREKQRVERAVETLQENGMVQLTWLEGGSWQDLQRAMRRGPWHVFHFVGHGRYDAMMEEGAIALVGETGETDELTATQLGLLLADHPSLRLALLNACEGAKGGKSDIFSGTAATLVRRGLPAVVAMQYEITDRAAIEFARTFYEAVADEMPLDAAVSEARKAVRLSISGTVEWGTPVLYMRSPDGVLFHLTSKLVSAPSIEPKAPLPLALTVPELEPESVATAASVPEPEVEVKAEPEPEVVRSAPAVFEPEVRPESTPTPQGELEPEPALPPVEQRAASPVEPAPLPEPSPAEQPRPAPAPTPVPAPEVVPVTAPAQLAAQAAYTFEGIDGRLEVTPESVALVRRGPGGVLYRQGERTVAMRDVTVVHLGPASAVGRGFIQVCFAGGPQTRASYWEAPKHPETLQFTLLNQPLFESAKNWIDYYAGLARAAAGSACTN